MKRANRLTVVGRTVLLSIAALLPIDKVEAVDKDTKFKPGPASSYKGAQTLEKITIAAVPYHTADLTKTAFGKVNPNTHGILPVLLVIDNGTGKAIRASDIVVEFVDLSNRHIESMAASDVVLFDGVQKVPKIPGTGPSPIPLPKRNKNGPLKTWEIEGRAFAAKLIPPGESASGFVYFQTSYRDGSKLYLSGLEDAATGQEFFYSEVPIEKQ